MKMLLINTIFQVIGIMLSQIKAYKIQFIVVSKCFVL